MKFKAKIKEITIFIFTSTVALGLFIFLITNFNRLRLNDIFSDTIDSLDTIFFSVNFNIFVVVFFVILPYLFFLLIRYISRRKMLVKMAIKISIAILFLILYYFSISYVFDCYINDNIWGQSYFKGKYKVCYTANLGDPCFQYTSKVSADFGSFVSLGKNEDAYAKDGKKVFYPYTKIDLCSVNLDRINDGVPNANPSTFEVLEKGYAKDKNNFYKDGEKFEITEDDSAQKTLQITIDSIEGLSANMLLYKNSDEIGVINFAKIAPGEFTAEIENSTSTPSSISDWSSSKEHQVLINAAYFNEDKTPSGYLVVNGETVGETLFDQDKSGLLVIQDDQFSIRDLATEPLEEGENFDFALQSYPFLIKNSEKAIKSDSGKKARRSAIGIDKEGNVYVLISDSPNLSLYEFMNILYDSEIDFETVLNLDGGPSSGLYVNFGRYSKLIDSQVEVPSILLFKALKK